MPSTDEILTFLDALKLHFRSLSVLCGLSTSLFIAGQTAGLFQMRAEQHLLQKDRRQYPSNPLISYLNINSVRNKIADLQIIMQNIILDIIFVLRETILDESFPNAHLNLMVTKIRTR